LVNFWGGKDDLFLTAELPGFNPEELDVSIQGKTIRLKGEKKVPELREGESFLRQERSTGTFNRTFELPFQIDGERVSADFQNGVLSIRMARAEVDKPKKISIQASE
jgi:HSP20 family protein